MLITINTLDPFRWREYKDLRLESLRNEPCAFLGTVQEEGAYPDTVWQERLEQSLLPQGNKMLFAQLDNNVVGMIGILCSQQEKIKHIAKLVSFYVAPEMRGKGIGKMLIEEALKGIKQRRYITKISLDVTVNQQAAIALYESFGFKKIALLKDNIKVNDIFYDEYLMEKL